MEITNEMGAGSERDDDDDDDDDDDVVVDDDGHGRYGSSLVEITHEVEAKEVGKVLMMLLFLMMVIMILTILMVPDTDPAW